MGQDCVASVPAFVAGQHKKPSKIDSQNEPNTGISMETFSVEHLSPIANIFVCYMPIYTVRCTGRK